MQQDSRVVKNIPLTCHQTCIAFGTESISKYNALKLQNDHIMFTDRKDVEDIKVVGEIMNILQVSGDTRLEPSGEHEK